MISFIKNLLAPKIVYGSVQGNSRPFRLNGEVLEVLLWEAGQQGHSKDYWCKADQSHKEGFKPHD